MVRIDPCQDRLNLSPSSSPLGKGRGDGRDCSSAVVLFVDPSVRILFRISIVEFQIFSPTTRLPP
jgi:hypothetical protein